MNRLRFAAALVLLLGTAALPARASNEIYRRVAPATVLFYEGGTGTGVLIDTGKRLVVTAEHVVRPLTREGTTAVHVVFAQLDANKKVITDAVHYLKKLDQLRIAGKVIYQDRTKDLALVQLERLPPGVAAVGLARDDPEPGEEVHVIGNSTLKHGGTFGYATGKVRNSHHYRGRSFLFFALAHHAPTNRGDSGGPVVNAKGELVGIVSQGTTGTQEEQVLDHSVHVREIRRALQGTQLPRGKSITLTMAVDSKGDDSFYIPVTKGEKVTIALQGKGSTDLDLYVDDFDHVDPNNPKKVGRLLVKEEGVTDKEKGEFTPDWTGTCRVRVRNLHLGTEPKERQAKALTKENTYTLKIEWAAPARGPVAVVRRLARGGTDVLGFSYEAGKGNGRVALRGDGDTDLNVTVLDPGNREVASGKGPTDREEATFATKATGVYTIRVQNLGKIWNEYTLTLD